MGLATWLEGSLQGCKEETTFQDWMTEMRTLLSVEQSGSGYNVPEAVGGKPAYPSHGADISPSTKESSECRDPGG